MSCLYLVNRPISAETRRELSAMLNNNDAVLLIEDGVYAACQYKSSAPFAVKIGVLLSDCQTRGVTPESSCFEIIHNYDEMLNWVLNHEKTVTWSN